MIYVNFCVSPKQLLSWHSTASGLQASVRLLLVYALLPIAIHGHLFVLLDF